MPVATDFCIHHFPIQFDMRKFNFTNLVITVWNTLPDTVVSVLILLKLVWIDFGQIKK